MGESSQANHKTGKGKCNKSDDYCWNFNRGLVCKYGAKCKYIERCSYCDKPSHGRNTCLKLKDKGQAPSPWKEGAGK